MKKRRLLFLCLAALLLLGGCGKNKAEPVYPDYDPAKTEAYAGVSAKAEVLSPHRVMLILENIGDTVMLDNTFALYDQKGRPVPCVGVSEAKEAVARCSTNEEARICLPLGNQYGALKAGNYTMVKRLVRLNAQGVYETCGYVSCPVQLPAVPEIHSLSEPMEVQTFLGDGTPVCQDIRVSVTEITPKGCTLCYQNDSDADLYQSGDYRILYMLLDGEWMRVPYAKESAYGPAYRVIEGKGSLTEIVHWSALYGSLPSGEYTLLVLMYGDDAYGDPQHLLVPFRIGE